MLTEKQLIDSLDHILVEELNFQTYLEFQMNDLHLDIQTLTETKQKQVRIDLAGINRIDSSIHFFEAETQLHMSHPAIYTPFCDYCYLVCPAVQFDILDSVTKQQQITWAENSGIGVITFTAESEFQIRIQAKKQELLTHIRNEVIRRMNDRFKIRFTTIPLWERSRSE